MNLEKSKVVITGGTGTFGKVFLQKSLHNDIFQKLTVFSRDEYKQYLLQKEIESKFPNARVNFILGDIRDQDRLKIAFEDADCVINAAAMKHVPACEYNPQEAIATNVNGAINVCNAANNCGVRKVIHLSTDKAAEPINLYGATKMSAEKYMTYSNNLSNKTVYSSVRYGNIVGSRGSIVEIFSNLIHENRKLLITDDKMTRFWMSIEDAVEMVLWSLINTIGGEIIIPKIKSSKLIDIAEAICEIHDKKMSYTLTGIRPGEKIHEQLMARSEYDRARVSNCQKYIAIPPEAADWCDNYIEKFENNYNNKFDYENYYSDNVDLLMDKEEIKHFVQNTL